MDDATGSVPEERFSALLFRKALRDRVFLELCESGFCVRVLPLEPMLASLLVVLPADVPALHE